MKRRAGRTVAGGLVLTAVLGFALAVAVTPGVTRTVHGSTETVPAAVTDNLRELNNKLARAIAQLDAELPLKGSTIKDTEHWRRTLNDLEATKLRAIDGFPPVFSHPYSETFSNLDCIDTRLEIGKIALLELEQGYLKSPVPAGTYFASKLVLAELRAAKNCKDALQAQLSGDAFVPARVSDDLRELNNKLARAIAQLDAELPLKGSTIKDTEHWRRTLNDLETTKLRAIDGFPPVFSHPYSETFSNLDCIDTRLEIGKIALLELEQGYLKSPVPAGTYFASKLVVAELRAAKNCKDALELQLDGSSGTPPPTTTTTPATTTGTTTTPTRGAYRGPIDNGTYLAAGNGSHIKLTVEERKLRITYGTDFRYVCQGNQTLHLTGKGRQVYSFDFHPGWAWHPISASGAFAISLFHHELSGEFTGPTSVRGFFQFDLPGDVNGDCHGNHPWTATLAGKPPASIGPIVISVPHVTGPVSKGEATRRDALFQTYLKPRGFSQDTTDPTRASNSATGHNAVWNRDTETWQDTKSRERLSGTGNDPAVLAYTFWWLDLFPKGFSRNSTDPYRASNASTGQNAVFDTQKLEWVDAKTGAPLSRSGR
ncbi:MAG: hypothetical protein ACYDA3_09655 [Gaiellaceae bacterium]